MLSQSRHNVLSLPFRLFLRTHNPGLACHRVRMSRLRQPKETSQRRYRRFPYSRSCCKRQTRLDPQERIGRLDISHMACLCLFVMYFIRKSITLPLLLLRSLAETRDQSIAFRSVIHPLQLLSKCSYAEDCPTNMIGVRKSCYTIVDSRE